MLTRTIYPKKYAHGFALLCFVVVIHWLIFPYPSGLLHWHCGNPTIAPMPAKQPWWIWINTSCEFIMNDCITTTEQSTTKPCAYLLGYTVRRYLFEMRNPSVTKIPVGCRPPNHSLTLFNGPKAIGTCMVGLYGATYNASIQWISHCDQFIQQISIKHCRQYSMQYAVDEACALFFFNMPWIVIFSITQSKHILCETINHI